MFLEQTRPGAYEGDKGGKISQGTEWPRGRRKIPTMLQVLSFLSQVLSSVQYICFRKTSGSNMGRQTWFLPRTTSNLVTALIQTQQEVTTMSVLQWINTNTPLKRMCQRKDLWMLTAALCTKNYLFFETAWRQQARQKRKNGLRHSKQHRVLPQTTIRGKSMDSVLGFTCYEYHIRKSFRHYDL